jgi:hypothetical protein
MDLEHCSSRCSGPLLGTAALPVYHTRRSLGGGSGALVHRWPSKPALRDRCFPVAYNRHNADATMTAAMTTTIAVALRTCSSPFVILIFCLMAQEELEDLICLAEVLKPSA